MSDPPGTRTQDSNTSRSEVNHLNHQGDASRNSLWWVYSRSAAAAAAVVYEYCRGTAAGDYCLAAW